MAPSVEWVQSVFSCQFNLNGKKLIAPNRDFPYEGLLAHLDGEHWKFIDCMAVAVRSQDGGYLSFVQDSPSVRLNPWSVTYNYRCIVPDVRRGTAALPFSVTYRLHSVGSPEVVTGSVELSFPAGLTAGRQRLIPLIVPLVDVRHMYGNTELQQYRPVQTRCDRGHQAVSITGHNRNVSFHFRGGEIERFASPETLHWHYKMGVGQRTESTDWATGRPATTFVGEWKTVAAFFCYRPSFGRSNRPVVSFFECRLDTRPPVASLQEFERLREQSIRKDEAQAEQVQTLFRIQGAAPLRDAVLGRIVGLTKFKTFVRNDQSGSWTLVPHAGAWWFHTPWYRDVFEGLLSSFKTLTTLPEERERMKETVRFALSSQDDATGLIPNRIPEFRSQGIAYNSSDASLLCFLVAEAYLRMTWEQALAQEVAAAAMKMVTLFAQNGEVVSAQVQPDGPPRLHQQTGLLLTSPQHSWIDTRSQCVEHAGHCLQDLPSRFSPAFVKALWDHLESTRPPGPVFASPCFFLPEINAQWIKMLEGLTWILDVLLGGSAARHAPRKKWQGLRGTVAAILERGRNSFLPVFWNKQVGYLFNAVYEDRLVNDAVECEAGVTAAAMLGEPIFSRGYLQDIWKCARHALLVSRRVAAYRTNGVSGESGGHREVGQNKERWRPFGIVVKNGSLRTFYDDGQYHGSVMWLRSTHYLVKLLRMIGKGRLARDVLLNVLEHQMTEGAIFYNHELLSPAVGNNPQARPATAKNPVPVKNPIQFWSQWCDQMIQEFGELKVETDKDLAGLVGR